MEQFPVVILVGLVETPSEYLQCMRNVFGRQIEFELIVLDGDPTPEG